MAIELSEDLMTVHLGGMESLTKSGEPSIIFGCDYNPEQWSPEVWAEDLRLMNEAGITMVAINIFGWAEIETQPGVYSFDRLDEVIDALDQHGIGVNLGTGTSSPPPWLSSMHPEILPETADGQKRWPGGRQAWCPSSPVFRKHAFALAEQVASRYGNHPAVKLWHVSNELGCHNGRCYCDVSAVAFRQWLQHRYGTVDELNRAWGTAFWSQRYSSFDDVLPPRTTVSNSNPTQTLDFFRFSSDELLDYYRQETEIIRGLSPKPVTTNFMVTAHIQTQDYWDWAPYADVIANDHYLDHRLTDPHIELSFAADLTRGLAGGGSWMLMEQAAGAVNWQPRNVAKLPGEMVRNSLTHVARGAAAVCFFQWRASVQGTEKFHSALLPHAGTDSRIWRETLELGQILGRLGEVEQSRVVASVALVFSWQNWWAADLDSHPSEDVRYLEQVHHMYRAFWEAGISVDVLAPGSDLSDYALVAVPTLYMVADQEASSIAGFVKDGGSALVTYFSGIVDPDDRIRAGGYPGAFRKMLGIRTDEFYPLKPDQRLGLDDGSEASIWSERIELRGADTVARFTGGPLEGGPAITRHEYGRGKAWYVGTTINDAAMTQLVTDAAAQAGVTPDRQPGFNDAEVMRRRNSCYEYVFIINHGTSGFAYPVPPGLELLTGSETGAEVLVPAGSARVVRIPRDDAGIASPAAGN
ncbi:MAG TPA: beta-galactosidase [Arthrobacter sp.]|nr:beta-galactosidase [Arthrobacter sp.]